MLDSLQDEMGRNDPDWSTLSGRVQWAVGEALKGRKQRELAVLLQVNRSTIVRWKAGSIDEPRDSLDELESLLGIRANWLAEGVGDPFIETQPAVATTPKSSLQADAHRSREEAKLFELLDELVQGLKLGKVGTGEEIAELRKGVEEWLETSVNRTNGNKRG